jgi:acid phosphatase (class A)
VNPAALLMACALLSGATAYAAGPRSQATQSAVPSPGYLSETALRSLAEAVPPPPVEGSVAALADIAASDRLRALENSDRWLLATRHAELRPALAIAHFECALGFQLSAVDSPRLVSLLDRVLHDANAAAELAKARAFRPRPVGVEAERPACTVVSAAGRASPSYPSGSATVGSAYGRVFTALAPEQGEALTRIGHEIAVSRMVCAMHYPVDVAAGETLGAAVFDQIAATPAFATDAEAARGELAQARATGLTSPACAAERAALAIPLP